MSYEASGELSQSPQALGLAQQLAGRAAQRGCQRCSRSRSPWSAPARQVHPDSSRPTGIDLRRPHRQRQPTHHYRRRLRRRQPHASPPSYRACYSHLSRAMVRVGDWELRLVRGGTGDPFPEVRQQSGAGTTYAVAAPGQEFGVQVIQHTAPYSTTNSTHMVRQVQRGWGD